MGASCVKCLRGPGLQQCGWCCGIFSVFAIIFLCVVAAVINSQSLVIDVDTTKTSRSSAVQNLLIAAGIYAAFLILSIFCVLKKPAKDSDGVSEDRAADPTQQSSSSGQREEKKGMAS